MKRILLIACIFFCAAQLSAQDLYWVFFTDKQHDNFNPYEYFDPKAIVRYQLAGADLYDETNYPVTPAYVQGVTALATEYVGESRWFNATAVTADEEQLAAIRALPYVADVQRIASEALMAEESTDEVSEWNTDSTGHFMEELTWMQGEKFHQAGFTGKGVRIAVFDGGFDEVDKHPAFAHLFKNFQIVKTWDFTKRKENVYHGHYHGRMVLSCIAGIKDDTVHLGLAPDAQFLLARTEVKAEKTKEEVWWVQALEWADQNGADIVNSSLGYGDPLHYVKEMDGRTSRVAKGAATAADKGILVCTAMGNEGSKKDWKVLVTPADVDKVLSVGSVHGLSTIAYYSSFGPTADGRLKPNVVAPGYDLVANGSDDYTYSQGTSFATPMVTGFAACVKQMHPDYTAMQLLKEIEKSGNHYPFYDYQFGYGIPQAGYFTGEKAKPESFKLYEDKDYVYLIPNDTATKSDITLFYKVSNGDGSIVKYGNDFVPKSFKGFVFDKADLEKGQSVHFWYNGTYKTYTLNKDNLPAPPDSNISNNIVYYEWEADKDNYYDKKSKFYSAGFSLRTGFTIPAMWSPSGNIHTADRVSRSLFAVWGNTFKLAKVYALGLNLSFGSTWFAVDSASLPMHIEQITAGYELRKKNVKVTSFDLEFFQRFYLSKSSRNRGILDMGIYGMWNTGSRLKGKFLSEGDDEIMMTDQNFMRPQMNKLAWGVRLRVGWEHFSIYGQYRISNLWKKDVFSNDLPKIEVGVQIF